MTFPPGLLQQTLNPSSAWSSLQAFFPFFLDQFNQNIQIMDLAQPILKFLTGCQPPINLQLDGGRENFDFVSEPFDADAKEMERASVVGGCDTVKKLGGRRQERPQMDGRFISKGRTLLFQENQMRHRY